MIDAVLTEPVMIEVHPVESKSFALRGLTRWSAAMVVAAAALLPATAHADDDAGPPDARYAGFSKTVDLGTGATATSWIFFGFLGVVTLSSLFKDAKRSHLD